VASGGAGPLSYSWDFDDRDGIQVDKFQQNPTFVFANHGSEGVDYTVTLTVSDATGYAVTETRVVSIYPRAYDLVNPIQLHGEDGVIIEGIEIADPGASGDGVTAAIEVTDCANVTIRDCYVHGWTGHALGLMVTGSENVVVETSTFENLTVGVSFENCTNCRFTGNVLHEGVGGHACSVRHSRGVEVGENVVRHWGTPDSWHNGIDFENTVDSSIHDNFVWDISGHGMYAGDGAARMQIYNNTIRHIHEEGLWLGKASQIDVYGNYIRPFGGWAINITDAPAHDCRVHHNVLYGDGGLTKQKCWHASSSRAAGYASIHMADGASGIVVDHNTMYDEIGIALVLVNSHPLSVDNVVRNNIIANRLAIHVEPGASDRTLSEVSYNNLHIDEENAFHEQYLDAEGTISRDPEFRDPARGNLMPKYTSPCIDAGDPASEYGNEPAPNGGRVNMGAFGNTPQATPDRLVTAVSGSAGATPEAFSLKQNAPNPFNGGTLIHLNLPGHVGGPEVRAELEVYNVAGQKVVTLMQGDYRAGAHVLRWDGRDANGGELGSGVYFYRLRAGVEVRTLRMVLLK